jgi:hypothetical protein
MPLPSRKAYWIDDLQDKHEAYGYEDSDVRLLAIEHGGRSLQLLIPESIPLTSVKVTASSGNLLFLIGEQLEEDDIQGDIIEGGDGVVMIARRHPARDDTYWLLVWHNIFPEALEYLP